MVNVVMLVLSLLLPPLHLAFTKGPWTRRNVLRVFLIYAFVFDVGAVGFLFGFVPHIFFADQAAELIGWPKGSMFQFEVGLHDGAWGILGFLCVFFGGGFWLATAIGWSFFMFGAAWGHVQRDHRARQLRAVQLLPGHHRHADPALPARPALRLLARRRPRRQAAPGNVEIDRRLPLTAAARAGPVSLLPRRRRC